MKDHEKRELVNELRDVAIKFHASGQLRERVSGVVLKYLKREEAQSVDPCGGCGETDANKRCIGCLHPFTHPAPPPSEQVREAKWVSRAKELGEIFDGVDPSSEPYDTCLSNCDTCKYSEFDQSLPDTAHCYMFRNEPVGVCGQWTEGTIKQSLTVEPVEQALLTERDALIAGLQKHQPEMSHELQSLIRQLIDMLAADAQSTSMRNCLTLLQRAEKAEGETEALRAYCERLKITTQQVAVPQGEVANLWCETCEGTSQVYEETQIGIPGSGGTHNCPDCEGRGYIESSVYRTRISKTAPQPPQAYALALPTDLTDDEIDAAQAAAYQDLVAAGYNGGMGGLTWDRASARAVLAAQRGKV